MYFCMAASFPPGGSHFILVVVSRNKNSSKSYREFYCVRWCYVFVLVHLLIGLKRCTSCGRQCCIIKRSAVFVLPVAPSIVDWSNLINTAALASVTADHLPERFRSEIQFQERGSAEGQAWSSTTAPQVKAQQNYVEGESMHAHSRWLKVNGGVCVRAGCTSWGNCVRRRALFEDRAPSVCIDSPIANKRHALCLCLPTKVTIETSWLEHCRISRQQTS